MTRTLPTLAGSGAPEPQLIEIAREGEPTIALERLASGWRMRAPWDVDADPDRVAALLSDPRCAAPAQRPCAGRRARRAGSGPGQAASAPGHDRFRDGRARPDRAMALRHERRAGSSHPGSLPAPADRAADRLCGAEAAPARPRACLRDARHRSPERRDLGPALGLGRRADRALARRADRRAARAERDGRDAGVVSGLGGRSPLDAAGSASHLRPGRGPRADRGSERDRPDTAGLFCLGRCADRPDRARVRVASGIGRLRPGPRVARIAGHAGFVDGPGRPALRRAPARLATRGSAAPA